MPVPVANRISVGKIADYLRSTEAFTAFQSNEIVVEWLVSEGVAKSDINTMLNTALGGLGYTGSIDDRMKQWRDAG